MIEFTLPKRHVQLPFSLIFCPIIPRHSAPAMPHATFPLATVDSTCGIGMVACFDRSVLVEDSSQGLAGLLSFEIFALTNHIVLLYPKSSSLDETFDECLDSDQCNLPISSWLPEGCLHPEGQFQFWWKFLVLETLILRKVEEHH